MDKMLITLLEELGINPKKKNLCKLKKILKEVQKKERARCAAYVQYCKARFEQTPELKQDISVAADVIREGLLAI